MHHRREERAAPKGLAYRVIEDVSGDAGFPVARKKFEKTWPIGSIVFLSRKWGRYKGTGHFLLRVTGGWMDPWMSSVEGNPCGGICDRLPRGTGIDAGLVPEPAALPSKRMVGRRRPSTTYRQATGRTTCA